MRKSETPRQFNRDAYEIEFEDEFTGDRLDPGRWVAYYLPHWTTPERSAARYDLADGELRLRIDADQPAWRAEEGELRASGLQTGASPDTTVMLAFWLVGLEDESSKQSGEICVIELFGNAIGRESSELSLGAKAHHDPSLRDDMVRPRLPIDATDWHTYGAAWTSEEIRFYVDDAPVHTVRQSIAYPMTLLVDLFEFPDTAASDPADYPKTGYVRAVRGYRRLA